MFTDAETGDLVVLKAGTVPPEQYAGRIGAQNFEDGEAAVEGTAAEPAEEAPAAEPAEAVDAQAAGDNEDGSPVDGTVDEVLGRVGDDPALAQAALEAEQAKGDKARSTLVEKLGAVAAASSSTAPDNEES